MIGAKSEPVCGLRLANVASTGGKGLIVTIDALIFVSKRLQRAGLAILCLMAAQLVLASCEPEPSAMAARVSLDGQ